MNLIEEIKNRLQFSDLLLRLGLQVNRSGFINSIYRQEKTASLKIYFKTNTYFCFGTNQGGDIIKFYSDIYNLDTKQTLYELASLLGLNESVNTNKQPENSIHKPIIVKPEKQSVELLHFEKEMFEERSGIIEFNGNIERQQAEHFAFMEVLEARKMIQARIFTSFYEYCNSLGFDEQAYNYITGSQRGLSEDSVKKFRLFSVPSGCRAIEFLRDNYSGDELILCGLFSKEYLLFSKHRIVIPYIENGKIVYLRGRYFSEGKSKPENTGKYIGCNNWSMTLSPKRLYNIDILKKLNHYEPLFICEGEFDSMIADQTGNNALAIAGVSNFPKDKVEVLKDFNLYFALDSDEAGVKALEEITNLFDVPVKAIKLNIHKDLTELLV